MDKAHRFILWFNELTIEDVPLVGGKNASLGEMYRSLTKKGVAIPNGFAITSYAYRYIIDKAGIKKEIRHILSTLDTKDVHNLSERGRKVRELIVKSEFPDDLKRDIAKAYSRLCQEANVKDMD